nr:hypothetical protein [uncultured Dyadobacter sp.]
MIQLLLPNSSWKPEKTLKVHNKGFYFFNLHIHRTLLLIDVMDNEATVVWAGTHEEYKATFKNNKDTIEKWLRARCWIN